MSLTHVILTKHLVGPITLHYRSGHVIVIALSQQCDWPILVNQYMQNHAAKTFSGCTELELEATIVIFFHSDTALHNLGLEAFWHYIMLFQILLVVLLSLSQITILLQLCYNLYIPMTYNFSLQHCSTRSLSLMWAILQFGLVTWHFQLQSPTHKILYFPSSHFLHIHTMCRHAAFVNLTSSDAIFFPYMSL